MIQRLLPAAAAVAVAAAPAALAQSYAVQLNALTPLTVQATFGGPTITQSLPAGPMTTGGSLTGQAPGTSLAQFTWGSESDQRHAACVLRVLMLASGGGGTASVGSHDVLVEFVPTGAPGASLTISNDNFVLAGSTAPTVQVDVGNDGTVDFVNPQNPTTFQVTAGQTLPVRVTMQADLGLGSSLLTSTLRLELVPDNNVFVQQTVAGCMNFGPSLSVDEVFPAQGVALSSQAAGLGVLVLGLNAAPTSLPITSPLPCLLLPSPDVLVLLPQFTPTVFPVALPAAVRPATFHAQAVAVSMQGVMLGVSPGYSIVAQ